MKIVLSLQNLWLMRLSYPLIFLFHFRAEQSSKQEYYIIHDSSNQHSDDDKESLECQLEYALERHYPLVVVEPVWLGDETMRWIRVGNFLHKSAVLASLGALITLPFLPRSIGNFTAIPLGMFGVSSAGLYDISWQFDPCCKYQVDYKGSELARIPSHELQSRTPVVLIRRNDKYRKILHNSLALIFSAYVGWRLYQYFNS